MKNILRAKRKAGFSLVEMLVVLCIISVVATASFMMLNAGIVLWKKFVTIPIEDQIRVFIDKFKKDVGCISTYESIKIEGDKYKFVFPAFVDAMFDPPWQSYGEKTLRQLTEISYEFKANPEIVQKTSKKLYSEDLKEEVLLRGITKFKFSYYYRESEKKPIKVYDKLETGVVPAFVKINVQYTLQGKKKEFSEIVEVPFARGAFNA